MHSSSISSEVRLCFPIITQSPVLLSLLMNFIFHCEFDFLMEEPYITSPSSSSFLFLQIHLDFAIISSISCQYELPFEGSPSTLPSSSFLPLFRIHFFACSSNCCQFSKYLICKMVLANAKRSLRCCNWGLPLNGLTVIFTIRFFENSISKKRNVSRKQNNVFFFFLPVLPEMPLPSPLPQTLGNKSLLFHPRVSEEAQQLLTVPDDHNLIQQLIQSLSLTSSRQMFVKVIEKVKIIIL